MTKLYEVANDYTQALEYLMDPERFQEGLDTLESIQETLNDKLDNIGRLRQQYLSEAAVIEQEIKRLKDRAETRKKQAAKLEDYVEYVLRQNKMEKVKTNMFDFGFTVSNSLVLQDLEEVPEHFIKIKREADIAGLKAHLKQKYEEMGYKLVSKLSDKPKKDVKEMLVTELDLEDLGVKFEVSEKLKIK